MKRDKTRALSPSLHEEASAHDTTSARLAALYQSHPAALRQVIAQHPNAPPSLLAQLSQVKALQALVAQNPNTPLPTLYTLWAQHPASLLQNPALPLWLLENPSFWRDLPDPVQAAVAALPTLDLPLLLSLWESARSNQVRTALLMHPLLPGELTEEAAKNPSLAAAVATRSDLSEATWLLLFGSGNHNVREAIEKNPARPERLMRLALQVGWSSRWTTSSQTAPAPLASEDLTYLASGGRYLQALVVVRPEAPAEALARIATSSTQELRLQVAQHPNASDETLLLLLREKVEGCAHLIARRPGLSSAVGLAILRLKGNSVSFQMALHELASKPETETPLLLRLLRVYGGHCAALLMARPTLPRSLVRAALQSKRPDLLLALVARQDLRPEDLERLSRVSVVEVRVLVAKHPNTPAPTRARLALDESPAVRAVLGEAEAPRPLLSRWQRQKPLRERRSLLQHETLPIEVWQALLNDANDSIAQAALAHPGLPPELKTCLQKAQAQQALTSAERETLASLGGLGARLEAAYYVAPRWLLEELFASCPREDLRALASHPIAPEALREWFLRCYPNDTIKLVTPEALIAGRDAALRTLATPALVASQLAMLVAHRDPLVRRSLAKHPSAPLVFLLSVIFGANLGEQLALLKNPALPEWARRWAALHPKLKGLVSGA